MIITKLKIQIISVKRLFKAKLDTFWILSSYTLISIIFTYPIIFRLNDFPYTGAETIPPGSDIFIYLWEMWWFKHAILNFINPFFTNYIFYPHGVSLLFTLANIIWSVTSISVQSFLSLAAIYNLFFISSLILSGMGAFWLIRYLTKNSWGSFIGGLIFAFAPYHFAHIGHMTVFSVQWLPFFILFFLKMFDERSWQNAIFAAIFWAATCYSDLNYAAFLAVFVILFFIFQLKYDKKTLLSVHYLRRVLLMVSMSIILVGPYGIPIVSSALSGQADISTPLHNSVSQSADLLSFFVPSFMHPVFGTVVRTFYDHITTFNGNKLGGFIEVTTFVGFTSIFLVVIALRRFGWRRLRFWIIITAFFFVLTLGPVLKAGGLVQIPAEWMHLDKIARQIEPDLDPLALEMMKKSVGIPLPYLIWHFIPLLSGSESAGRLDIMFVLGWAVLCGFGIMCIIENVRKQNLLCISSSKIVCLFLVLLILFEYAPIPIKMIDFQVSAFYKKLANDPDDYALMDLPILNNEPETDPHTRSNRLLFKGFNNTSSKRSLYYQTVHHKKIVNGMTCRAYSNIRDFIDNTPVVRLLAYPELILKETAAVDVTLLQKHKIKYIVLHRTYLTKNEFWNLMSFLGANFRKVFDDPEIVAYQTYY